MSFILDALKKSENERQQQASTEFAAIPAAASAPGAPRWIWLLIGLLIVNVAIVAIAMFRNDTVAPTTSSAPEPAETPQQIQATPQVEAQPVEVADDGTGEPSFAERINTAARSRPAPRRESAPAPQRTSNAASTESREREAGPGTGPQAPVSATSAQALPTLNEIRLNDGVDLPDLHIDIHVYSQRPADRFVFINMQKHREGTVLASGPRVDEITPDGVVLDYQGTRFVLPRE
jgi:general secretion pathway protein B